LEVHSHRDESAGDTPVLEAQLRESFGRVTYSHKTQEKCADILLCWASRIKNAQIMLAALSSVGIISTLFGSGVVGSATGSLLAATLLALNLYTRENDMVATAQNHRQAASKMWLIRERYLSIITDLKIGNKSIEIIQQERDGLVSELGAIYSSAPSTNSRAYERARIALKYNEEMTFSVNEIDSMLPIELRKTQNTSSST